MRVLVMDDEPAVLKVVLKMIQSIGHEGVGTKDGIEAIEVYRNALNSGEAFDVIIMDLTIPGGMGGKEAIDQLLKIDPGITAIVSSGYSGDPVMSNYESFGFKGIITKPFNLSDLKKVMADCQNVTRSS